MEIEKSHRHNCAGIYAYLSLVWVLHRLSEDIYILFFVIRSPFLPFGFRRSISLTLPLAKNRGPRKRGVVALVVIPPAIMEVQVSAFLVCLPTWLLFSPCVVRRPIWWLCWCIVRPSHLALFSLHAKPYPSNFLLAHQAMNKSVLGFWFNDGELCWHLLAFVLSII